MIKIAVDAMGGDFAPCEIVKGSVAGAIEHKIGVIFVGQENAIKSELNKYDTSKLDIDIIHTDEFLVEGESPSLALRNKSNSSIMLCVKLVKEGKAGAVISAGPTGGLVASAVHILGTLEGVSRPCFGGPFIGFAPDTILIDLGCNIDAQSKQLVEFAMMGTVYSEMIMGIENPTVAIASVGSEEEKGNRIVREAYKLLKQSNLNFIGNIEGNDIVQGKANVVICDGFVGNILLKFSEGLSLSASNWLQKRLSQCLSNDELVKVTSEFDVLLKSSISGGLLLGINGVICKAHGKSKAQNIANLILTAKNAIEKEMTKTLTRGLAALNKTAK